MLYDNLCMATLDAEHAHNGQGAVGFGGKPCLVQAGLPVACARLERDEAG